MANEPLRTPCPCCSGSGKVSYLRSGEWINVHCPGLNGPVDVDSSPMTHELDNYRASRKIRIEYKRPGERMNPGQLTHFVAELDSTKATWRSVVVIVMDEGQENPSDDVDYKKMYSTQPSYKLPEKWTKSTVNELGMSISAWLWPHQESNNEHKRAA